MKNWIAAFAACFAACFASSPTDAATTIGAVGLRDGDELRKQVERFVAAASFRKDDEGIAAFADPSAAERAALSLAPRLAELGVSGEIAISLDSGLTIRLGIGDAAGGADLVVAIGRDGDPSGSGGAATATNSSPGGAALAVGGRGGLGATQGGAATATALHGHALAFGGAGGPDPRHGGPGGPAVANNLDVLGVARARGGDGGSNGGVGGSAVATAGQAEAARAVVNVPGGAGSDFKGGRGAFASLGGGAVEGSYGND
jgi:hypothetical protein